MLGFNFELNHKCVRKDNITKMGSEVSICSVHRSLDLTIKNREPNQIRSI